MLHKYTHPLQPGEAQTLSGILGSAPAVNNSFTTGMWPNLHALSKAVLPVCTKKQRSCSCDTYTTYAGVCAIPCLADSHLLSTSVT